MSGVSLRAAGSQAPALLYQGAQTLQLSTQFLVLAGWVNRRQLEIIEYLREENRILKEALQAATGKTQIPLTNEQRRRLASKGKALTPQPVRRPVLGRRTGTEKRPFSCCIGAGKRKRYT